MRRGWVVIFLMVALLVLPLGSVRAQGSKGVDGTVWTKLNTDNKSLFTLGYFTGIQIFAKFVPGPCTTCTSECLDEASSKLVPLGTSIPQVVGMVDSIYQDPANLVIPVQWSLKLAAQKAKGMSDEDFKTAILDARAGSTPAPAEAAEAPAEPAAPPKP
jgi:hypothetical protein